MYKYTKDTKFNNFQAMNDTLSKARIIILIAVATHRLYHPKVFNLNFQYLLSDTCKYSQTLT